MLKIMQKTLIVLKIQGNNFTYTCLELALTNLKLNATYLEFIFT